MQLSSLVRTGTTSKWFATNLRPNPFIAATQLTAHPRHRLEIVVLYMIVEHFKNHDAIPVYRRFRDRGRLAPDGLQYVSSWVDEKLERCFQIMETSDRNLLDQWIANWSDIVEFDVFPVISSKEAAEMIAPRL
jgi:Protein of unknown function (DUF3303)